MMMMTEAMGRMAAAVMVPTMTTMADLTSSPRTKHMETNKSYVLVGVLGAFLLTSIAVYVYWKWPSLFNGHTPRVQIGYEALVQTNPSFAAAEKDRQAGNFTKAQAEYIDALSTLSDGAGEQIVKLRLAFAVRDAGKDAEAISLFKEIAANTSYNSVTRAYAVQNMVQMYGTLSDDRITQEIFKDAPYSVLFVKGNAPLSYRHLAEYASAFYPIALSESYIANRYASELVAEKKKMGANMDKAFEVRYLNLIQEKLQNTDRDIVRIKSQNPVFWSDIPTVFLFRARAVERLDLAGYTLFGTAESTYEDTLSAYAEYERSSKDGYARFYYAKYLWQKFGDARKSDIAEILAPLYENNQYANETIMTFFKNVRVSDPLNSKKPLIHLADIDPKFKALLSSLGWKDSDFK